MILTVEEAKMKWCPMAYNNTVYDNIMCCGSKCMAWRTVPVPSVKQVNPVCPECQGSGIVYFGEKESFACECITWEKQESKGYCGLAGEPK